MKATVSDIIQIMETVAPSRLAEDWDNAGLQVGEKGWPVEKIWIALDPAPEVVVAACKNKVDLLITHHPLIFSPLKKIDFSTPLGNIIRLAGEHKMTIFSAHTNLDNTSNGLNDILAKKIGLKNVKVLKPSNTQERYKLVVFVPSKYEKKILDVLIEAAIGTAGYHDPYPVRYTTQEAVVSKKSIEFSEEKPCQIDTTEKARIETTVDKEKLSEVIDTIRVRYPYDDIPYDIYPLCVKESSNGAGRIGDLGERINLSSFAEYLRKMCGIKSLRIAGNPDLLVDRVAVCSGSGSSLINEFISSGAQVFVSGDVRYHDARSVEQAGLAIIDMSHFASEFIIVDELGKRLRVILDEKNINASVEACSIEKDPYWSPDT